MTDNVTGLKITAVMAIFSTFTNALEAIEGYRDFHWKRLMRADYKKYSDSARFMLDVFTFGLTMVEQVQLLFPGQCRSKKSSKCWDFRSKSNFEFNKRVPSEHDRKARNCK